MTGLLFANDRRGAYPASYWAATAGPPPDPSPPATGQMRADVCIVGGGYTGLSAALHLARAGVDVLLLEAHRLGFGASGRNGGQLGSGQRVDPEILIARHGASTARLLWDMGEDAKALVLDLIVAHGIDCDLRPGVLHAEETDAGTRHAHALADRLRRDFGYDRVEPMGRDALQAILPVPAYRGGVLDHGAGHLHPLKLALGLAAAARAAGARLHEASHVTRIHPGSPVRIETAEGAVVRADHLVLACNGYLDGLEPHVAARVMPINNFILATEPLGARAETVLRRPVAVADGRFVVNYFRLSPEGRLLFGGGETYGYHFPQDLAAPARRPMLRLFPHLADVRIDFAWGGTLAITRSRLPAFLRPAPGVISASGYSGHGVALSILAGRATAEALRGDARGFDLLARLPVRRFPGGTTLRRPLLVLAMIWYALRDRLGI